MSVRAEKGEAQLKKSGAPALSSNQSFKKNGNGQTAQSRANPAKSGAEEANRGSQNGLSAPGGPKPAGMSTGNSRVLSKAPDSASSKPPAQGDASRAFTLQFGTISPGIMNGMQVPARTSSAPPNLHEQKHDQARHNTFGSTPTQTVPAVQKQPQQETKKDEGSNQSNTGASHPPTQAKRDAQISSPSAPILTPPKPSVIPIGGMPIAMPFQQSKVPLQFGGHGAPMQAQGVSGGTLQMPMALPVGNGPQVPHQMFIHGMHSHQLQPQAMMHQGQGLGFAPQMGQLVPQLGNIGLGIPPQFSQQQPGKFGSPRKTSVKITHPETHEELRLDRRTDSYTDNSSSGQRPPPNVTPQPQSIPPFPPTHQISYYPQLQPNSYSTPPVFFPTTSHPLTSTQMTTGSQGQRYNYPTSQGRQPIPYMNQPTLNSLPSSTPGAVSLEGLPASAIKPSVQVTMNPPAASYAEKAGIPSVTVSAPISKAEPTVAISASSGKIVPSVTISRPVSKGVSSVTVSKPTSKPEPSVTIRMPISKAETSTTITMPSSNAETPKISKPLRDTTAFQLQREVTPNFSSQQSKPTSEPSENVLVPASDRCSIVAPAVLSTQRVQPGDSSSAPVSPLGDSISVAAGNDGRKREPVRRSESLKEQQKRSSKKDARLSQHHQQTKASDPAEGTLLSSSKNNVIDTGSRQVFQGSESNQTPTVADSSISTVILLSPRTRHSTLSEVGTSGKVKEEVLSISSEIMPGKEASGDDPSVPSVTYNLANNGASVKQSGPCETSSSLCPKVDEMSSAKEEGVASDDSTIAKACELNDCDKQKNNTCSEAVGILEIDRTTEGLAVTTSSEFIHAESVSSSNLISGNADEAKPPPQDVPTNKSEVICSQDVVLTDPVISSMETANLSETSQKWENKATDLSNAEQVSMMVDGTKDDSFVEPNRIKATGGKKKKRKEILSKADAAGTSDLYNAYKGPEEKQEAASTFESAESCSKQLDAKLMPVDVPDKDAVAGEGDESSKTEFDDWEDAADISTPKLKTPESRQQVDSSNKHDGEHENEANRRKKYSRDFLLTFAEQCTDLPLGFEIGSDIADLMGAQMGSSRESHPSHGRIVDRPSGGSRADRRMGGMHDDGKWNRSPGSYGPGGDFRGDVEHGAPIMNFRPGQGINHGILRNPRGQPSSQSVGGSMQYPASQGGVSRNNSAADRWHRAASSQRGLMPPPQTPLQIMHKAERKYEVGKVSDQEEAKQRQLKGILNKLTPQNFDKLFAQVKEVNIDNAVTLTGVISQIFDKALMEPTFCEMYANFCFHLAGALPDFNVDNEKITFKRLLLNKCQEEFERGEREQEEANKVEEEGEVKQSEEAREEKRLRSRRRMLGNIRLIGELYKKKMLTEKIMHVCINTLLGQHQNPDEEDIEALCKLMSTIGEMIDHLKARVYMDAYYDVMQKLSTNQKLSSRVRFMLRDAIDLRKNKWQQRRKVEGPKTIEEVHRDAAQERHAQTIRSSRGSVSSSSGRRGQPIDYGPRGSSTLNSSSSRQTGTIRSLPSQNRGYAQDVRLGDRHQFDARAVPLQQRPIDSESITLGPQGGLARGMSIRGHPLTSNFPSSEVHPSTSEPRTLSDSNGHRAILDQAPFSPKEEMAQRSRPVNSSVNRVFDRSTTTPLSTGKSMTSSENMPAEAKALTEEGLREKSIAAIREFYSAKDEEEVALCVRELKTPSYFSSMVSLWVTDSFERKDMERDLLAKLLVNLCKSHNSLLSHVQLIQGFESALSLLEDAVNDAPRAAEFLGRIFAEVIVENVLSLKDVGKLIHESGEEPGRLLEIGLASEVLGSILETIRIEKGDIVLNEIKASSNLQLEDFRPPHPVKSKKLEEFL